MGKILITKMKKEDLFDICNIEKEAFPIPWQLETFEHELSNMFAEYLVAKVDNKVVGFIGAWFILDECQITSIAVHKNYRKQGIASRLVTKLLCSCKKHETNYIMLEVRINNFAAQKLYSKFGFKEETIRKKYYKNPDGTREDAIVMSKILE